MRGFKTNPLIPPEGFTSENALEIVFSFSCFIFLDTESMFLCAMMIMVILLLMHDYVYMKIYCCFFCLDYTVFQVEKQYWFVHLCGNIFICGSGSPDPFSKVFKMFGYFFIPVCTWFTAQDDKGFCGK